MSKFPTNTQELFEAYITDELALIAEFSCSQSKSNKIFILWAEKYAEENNLIFKNKWRIYLDDI